jgi:metallo-beta-lactamase family protein
VRASVHTIGGLSAHADRDALLGWLRGFDTPPQRTFVVHGEAATACGFADRIADELGWSVEAPAAGSRVDL